MTDLQERDKFLSWETAARDTIDFKKLYVDMTGDHLAALALSEIVYWHLPSKQGGTRLRVNHEGELWIACPRYEWWDRTRMSPRQIDGALKKLVKANLVVKKFYAYNRAKTTHVRINWDAFLLMWNSLINAPLENPYEPKSSLKDVSSHQSVTTGFSPFGERVLTDPATPITETTAKTNKEEEPPPQLTTNAEPIDSLLDDPDFPTHVPPHVLRGLGMGDALISKRTREENKKHVAYVTTHPVWKAFAAGWDGITPICPPTLGSITRIAVDQIQARVDAKEFTLEDVTRLTRIQLKKARSTDYRISFIPIDMPGYLANKRAETGGVLPVQEPTTTLDDLPDASDFLPLDEHGRYIGEDAA